MFKSFFNTASIDAFAGQVVAEMLKQMPPQHVGANDRKAQRGNARFDARLARMVEELHQKSRLNIYQKAKLAPRLQDAMEAAGYSPEFSKSLCYDIALLVAQSAPRR
jgi:hypothetical protein